MHKFSLLESTHLLAIGDFFFALDITDISRLWNLKDVYFLHSFSYLRSAGVRSLVMV